MGYTSIQKINGWPQEMALEEPKRDQESVPIHICNQLYTRCSTYITVRRVGWPQSSEISGWCPHCSSTAMGARFRQCRSRSFASKNVQVLVLCDMCCRWSCLRSVHSFNSSKERSMVDASRPSPLPSYGCLGRRGHHL